MSHFIFYYYECYYAERCVVNVVMLSVVAPVISITYAEFHILALYAECRSDECRGTLVTKYIFSFFLSFCKIARFIIVH